MVAPGCGLPLVRLMTVPSIAAEAMETRHNSVAQAFLPVFFKKETQARMPVLQGPPVLREMWWTVIWEKRFGDFMPELPSSVSRIRRRISGPSGPLLYNWGKYPAAPSSWALPEPPQP